jgi:hypothetical protein
LELHIGGRTTATTFPLSCSPTLPQHLQSSLVH